MTELKKFTQDWNDQSGCKDFFCAVQKLAVQLGLKTEYVRRPGVSHSLRLGLPGAERPFFALADVIDDDPEKRWLSVCMYADVADDAEKRGDVVPKGLNDQDAVCFDIDGPDAEEQAYILKVLERAAAKSKN